MKTTLQFGLRKPADSTVRQLSPVEEEEGWYSGHIITACHRSILVHIEDGELHLSGIVQGQFFQNRGHALAVPSPGGEELYDDRARKIEDFTPEGTVPDNNRFIGIEQ